MHIYTRTHLRCSIWWLPTTQSTKWRRHLFSLIKFFFPFYSSMIYRLDEDEKLIIFNRLCLKVRVKELFDTATWFTPHFIRINCDLFTFLYTFFYISFGIFWPITTFYLIYFLLKRKRMVSVFPTGYDWWIHFQEFYVRDHFSSYASRFTRAICEPVLQFFDSTTVLRLQFDSVGGSAQIESREARKLEAEWHEIYNLD